MQNKKVIRLMDKMMSMKNGLRTEKGQAGLNVFLSIIVMIFMIGLIVMVFVIAGANLEDSIDDAEAIQVINETKLALADVPDWFGIFIVLGALVVLVLLVVIIINSIRASGVTGGGGA